VNKKFSVIPEYLESLEPKEKLEIIIKLLNYAVPKVKAIESSDGEPFKYGI